MTVSFARHPAVESIASAGGQDIGEWMMGWGIGIGMLDADPQKQQASAALSAAATACSAVSAGGPWPPAQEALGNFLNALQGLVAAADAQGRLTLIPAMNNIVKTLSTDLAALNVAATPPPPPVVPPTTVQAAPGSWAATHGGAPDAEEPEQSWDPAAHEAGQQLATTGGAPAAPDDPAAAPAAPASSGYAYSPPPAPAPNAAAGAYIDPNDPAGLHGSGWRKGSLSPMYQMHYHHHPVMMSLATSAGTSVVEWLGTWGIMGLSVVEAPKEMADADAAFTQASQLCAQISAQGRAPQGTKEALNNLVACVRAIAYQAAVQQKEPFIAPVESLADSLNNEVNGRHHFRF